MTCPTPCDDDCDANCHEAHDIRAKRQHSPDTCPGRLALCGIPCGCEGKNPTHYPAGLRTGA